MGAFAGFNSLILNEYKNGLYIENQYTPYIYLFALRDAAVKSMTIADGTRIVSESAFSSCEQIEEVVIPDSIKQIGIYSFGDCPALKAWKDNGIYYLGANVREKTVAI